MNHHQRFLAAVRGEPTDRPPVTAWMHFRFALPAHMLCFDSTLDSPALVAYNTYTPGISTTQIRRSLHQF